MILQARKFSFFIRSDIFHIDTKRFDDCSYNNTFLHDIQTQSALYQLYYND